LYSFVVSYNPSKVRLFESEMSAIPIELYVQGLIIESEMASIKMIDFKLMS